MKRQDDQQMGRRSEVRHEVDFGAVVHRGDGTHRVVGLGDLSYQGCAIDGAELEPAEQVRLVVPTLGDIGAQVRWSRGGRSGARFTAIDSGIPGTGSLGWGRPVNYGSGRVFGRKGLA